MMLWSAAATPAAPTWGRPAWAGTVSITVGATNDPPATTADSKSTNEDLALSFSASDLTTNDSPGPANESGQTLTVTAVMSTTSTNGTVGLASGLTTYTPDPDFNGAASFTYTVCDNGSPSECAQGTVNVTVNPVNDAPSFTKGSDQVVLDNAGAVSVPGWATGISAGPPDESTQGLTFTLTNNDNGLFSVQPTVSASGTLTFTVSGTTGTATVTLTLKDDGGTANGGVDTSAAQAFTITVNASNVPPDVVADSYSTDEDTPLNVAAPGVLGNDTDANGNSLTAVKVTDPTYGTLTLNANGSFTYTPAANYNGPDSFTYKANDGTADSAVVTVTLTVISVNDTPVVTGPSNQASDEGAVTSFSLGTFADPDGGPWSVVVDWGDGSTNTAFNATSSGLLSSQSHAYPDNETYTVTVTVTDSTTLSSQKTFQVTVSNVAPTATFNAPNEVFVGASINLSLTGPFDPSSVDTTTGFTYAFDCGSGYGTYSATSTTSCPTTAAETRTVKGKIRDKDGGESDYTHQVEIKKADQTITFGPLADKTYGDAPFTVSATASSGLTVTFTASGQCAISGNTVTITGTGSCTVTAYQASNASYNAAPDVPRAFAIGKAVLTVTADNKTRAYGDANPTFSASYSGFVNGETLATSGVTGAPSLTTTATTTSSVSGSPYPITVTLGTLSSANYSFSFVNGTLTVTKATLTETADNKTKNYGEANPTLTYTITGFMNGEMLATSGVTGIPSLTTSATAGSLVGTYPISADAGTLAASNYSFSFVNGTLTVVRADGIVAYIGQTVFVSSGSSSTTAQVTLSASVQDPRTGTSGSVANSTVTFKDLLSSKVLASGVKVSPVSNTSTATGTANTIVTLSTGQYGAQQYLIEVILDGQYTNCQQTGQNCPSDYSYTYSQTAYDAAHPIVTVMIPQTINSMQGAAQVTTLPTAAGTYGDATGAGYSVGIKYNNKGTNPQGQIQLILERADGTYYVKSNSITSVAFSGPLSGVNKKVTVYTKASIYRIDNSGALVSVDGNVSLRFDAYDGGTSSGDTVGVTVLSSKDSKLYYSNNWVYDSATRSWKTVQQSVSGPAVQIN